MTTEIVSFDFEGAGVRCLSIDGEPWFIAKDVADVLGYADTAKAIKAHCKCYRPVGVGVSPTLDPQTNVIPERDLYRLIMRSKLPAAERFEDWVVGEVLPAIRKTGRYEPAGQPAPSDQAFDVRIPFQRYERLLQDLIAKQDHIAALERKLSKVAGRDLFVKMAQAMLTTGLSDEDIAHTMEDVLGSYAPEWVAWQRRKLGESSASS
ncbi:Bro-N domain-containing protein [Caenispirillum bisanense]|uniref:BRO family, N-terminal domain n=1 Tax=Caenispirillum bisanense TaxID=414052 RepID=A0A286GSN7_9PROT|nr:BRO family protein [Caenispirillum bisanense]SOD98548.1 BRO family, N-terminal domain [Caenispirillum bisanense]